MSDNDSVWLRCPICNGKTRVKINKNTVLLHFPLYCPKCKKVVEINVVQLKMLVSES